VLGVVIDLAPVLLIILCKEVVDVLILSVLWEISLHDFQALGVYLHALYIATEGIQELIAPFTVEIGNDTLVTPAPRVFLVPRKEAIESLQDKIEEL
jgi:hypothetical protein